MSKKSRAIEIAIEVAWQIGDTREDIPRAMSRWVLVDIVQDIIKLKLITKHSVDIDEIIEQYLHHKGVLA